ncbi:Uncharacterised protein [Legionella jordanis]|nr:Uncharacterised protein [Legionella jordanis]
MDVKALFRKIQTFYFEFYSLNLNLHLNKLNYLHRIYS